MNTDNKGPAQLFERYEPLECARLREGPAYRTRGCLRPRRGAEQHPGIRAGLRGLQRCVRQSYEDSFCLQRVYSRGCMTSWEDIRQLANPLEYCSWLIRAMNGLQSGDLKFASNAAYKEFTHFALKMAQLVAREPTDRERAAFRESEELRLSRF